MFARSLISPRLTSLQRLNSRSLTRTSTTNESVSASRPWFLTDEDDVPPTTGHLTQQEPEQTNASLRPAAPPLPPSLPPHLLTLYAHLSQSPLLNVSSLVVRRPPPLTEDDLAATNIPFRRPQGRRRRGGTETGDGFTEPGGMWDWHVVAEVKEGTEGRGAIEAVVRSARATVSDICNLPCIAYHLFPHLLNGLLYARSYFNNIPNSPFLEKAHEGQPRTAGEFWTWVTLFFMLSVQTQDPSGSIRFDKSMLFLLLHAVWFRSMGYARLYRGTQCFFKSNDDSETGRRLF